MSWVEKYREIDSKVDAELNLSKKFPGYFNKWVFRVMMVLVIVFVLLAGQSVGWRMSGSYVECASDWMPCDNPLYNPSCLPSDGVCSMRTLLPGTIIGDRPGFWFENAENFMFLSVFFALGVNHLLYLWRTQWSK